MRPLPRYPARGSWRWELVASFAVVLLGLGFLYEGYVYMSWGTLLPAEGPPPRVEWCGRRYYPGYDTVTPAALATELGAGQLRQVASTPSGLTVLASPLSPQEQASHRTSVCAMAVYVRVQSDSYLPYWLSGGP